MIERIAKVGTVFACFGAIFIVAVTFADVIGSKLFNKPVIGSYELVMLSQVFVIGLAGAEVFLRGRHVQVEFFVDIMPKPARLAVMAFVGCLSLFIFGILTVEGFAYGESLRRVRETSGTINLPLYPFAYVLGFSALFLVLVLARHLVNTFKGLKDALYAKGGTPWNL